MMCFKVLCCDACAARANLFRSPLLMGVARVAGLFALLLFLTSSALAQTPEPKPAANKPSMLGSFLQAGMPDEILFAVRKPSIDGHWYASIAYYSTDQCRTTFPMNSGGKLCIYNVKTKQVRTIFEDPEGNIRDPQIHYDASKLIFAYLPKGKRHYSLYEINLDGSGLVQLTGKGEDVSPGMEDYQKYSPPGWDDFEPTYLPDGQIIFCSTRANRYVQCWMTQVGTLYKCDADGSNIRMLSANIEQDNTPWVLANGQVAYMRWEYVDRFHMGYHHLWSMNPDGTRQMVLYGNQINTGTILAPKPVPHSPKLVVTWSPGHGMREHYGRIALVDPRLGPDDPQGVQYISKSNIHCDPWAFSESHFLVANKAAIELMNSQGETELLHQLPDELAKAGYWIGEPRPVMASEREPVIADQTAPSAAYGTLALANIYRGRKMKNVAPGTVKNLLIYEVLPKPINYAGAMSEMSAGGTFSVERLIGSVPVSEEGSACFKLPALRSFLFLAMDAKGHCVKRMHSFTSVMPAQPTTCVGCHDSREDHEKAAREYATSIHGSSHTQGALAAATCADCHDAHRIFPKEDPRSSISAQRRLSTCQKCHASATAGFAKYDPHADTHNPRRNPILSFTSQFMKLLLGFVFAFFGVHTLLWLPRSAVERRRLNARRRGTPPPAPEPKDGPEEEGR